MVSDASTDIISKSGAKGWQLLHFLWPDLDQGLQAPTKPIMDNR